MASRYSDIPAGIKKQLLSSTPKSCFPLVYIKIRLKSKIKNLEGNDEKSIRDKTVFYPFGFHCNLLRSNF
jgi:hypothetical protein